MKLMVYFSKKLFVVKNDIETLFLLGKYSKKLFTLL